MNGANPSKSLRLLVKTPVTTLLDLANVRWVQVQLADGGAIGVWPQHAPLLAATVAAPLRYADEVGDHSLRLEAGVLHIQSNQVVIYTTEKPDAQALTVQSGRTAEGESFARLAEVLLGGVEAGAGRTMGQDHGEEK